jgi:hypothetical protein
VGERAQTVVSLATNAFLEIDSTGNAVESLEMKGGLEAEIESRAPAADYHRFQPVESASTTPRYY